MLDLPNAKKYYEKAIKLDPKYAEAINNLGAVYYAAKSYRRAVEQYKRAMRYSPESASILSNLGTAYFARKQYKEASIAYEKALAIDPTSLRKKTTGAGTVLQERSVEERAKYHYYIAKTYAKSGSNDLALQYIRKSLEEGFKEREKFYEGSGIRVAAGKSGIQADSRHGAQDPLKRSLHHLRDCVAVFDSGPALLPPIPAPF